MLEALITSSVLITAITLLRALLKNRVSARLIYALWLIAAIRLMLPFSLLQSPVSVMNAAESLPLAPVVQSVELPEPEAANTAPAAAPGNVTQAERPGSAEPDGVGVELEPVRPQEPESTGGGPNRALLAKSVYILGAALFAVGFIAANGAMYFRLRGIRRRLELPDAGLRVYLADGLPSPCLFGIIRPGIYLTPASLETEERMCMVLLHESTHYRHGDHIWSLLRCILLCAYWFDPLVWLAAYLSRRDAELACDESCIRALGKEKRLEYGGALVDLLDRQSRRAHVFQTATTMSAGKRAVKERIVRIARAPRTRAAAVILTVLLIAAVSACTFTGAEGEPRQSGESLSNASAYTRLPDGSVSQSLDTHKFSRDGGELTLYAGERGAVTLELAGDSETGVFLSDSLAAVACGSGRELSVMVSRDRGGSWEYSGGELELPEAEQGYEDYALFIGFSTDNDGWLVLNRLESSGRYAAYIWFTDDGGETWLASPNALEFDDALSGIAFTPDGFCMAALNSVWGHAYVELYTAPGQSGTEVYASGGELEGAGAQAGYTAFAPRVTESGFEYYLAADAYADDEEGFLLQSCETPDDGSGFWRIPDERDYAAVESAELATGLYAAPLRDINGDFVHQFWSVQFAVPGPGGTINTWAAVHTTGNELTLEVRNAFYDDSARVQPGESYGKYTLTPDTLLLVPVPESAPGSSEIGVCYEYAGGLTGCAFTAPEPGRLSFEAFADPESTGHGVYLRRATPEFLLGFEGYDEFRGYDIEEEKLLFTAICSTETVYDIEVFELLYGYYFGSEPERGETLYTQELLSPDRPLVVGNLSVGDVRSARGFAFTTSEGKRYEYYISLAYATMIDGTIRPVLMSSYSSGVDTGTGLAFALADEDFFELYPESYGEYPRIDLSVGRDDTLDFALIVEEPVTDVEFFELDYSDGYIYPAAGEVIADVDTIYPAFPLIITIPSEEALIGVGYTDSASTRHEYYVDPVLTEQSGSLVVQSVWGGYAYGGYPNAESADGVYVNWAYDAVLGGFEGYDIYRSYPTTEPYVSMAAICTASEVENLRIFEVYFAEDGSGPRQGRELFRQERLTPERPLVIDLVDHGNGFLTRGFSFTDSSGDIHAYAFTTTGKDNALHLAELSDGPEAYE